jgi:hypothetical protein
VLNVHGVGTWLSLAIVAAVGLAVALSFAMNAASEDARQQVLIVSSHESQNARAVWGPLLSRVMLADVPPSDVDALTAQAEQFDRHADRIRELAAAASLGALVLMLATARPEVRVAPARAETSPAASTRSNGTV